MTNVYPSVVGFFSHEATLGGCEIDAFPSEGPLNHVRNNDFAKWDPNTALPVGWYVSGAGVRVEPDRNSRPRGSGNISARLVVGTDQVAQLGQWLLLPRRPEPYRLVATMWVKADTPRRVRLYVGKASPKFSRFHPGDGTWQLLVAEINMSSSLLVAPTIQVGVQIEAGDPAVANLDEATLLEGVRTATSAVSGPAEQAWANAGSVESPSSLVRPRAVDPSRCHAVWIRGYPSSTAVVPTHYVLFRSFFTGFTLCRETECLDRLEGYLGSRYPITFQNSLATVFRLEHPPSR
jgi:hypothetical protein